MATNFPDTSIDNPFVTPPRPWINGDEFDDTTKSGLTYYWNDPVWKTKAGDITVPSLNGGPLAGFRNYIINGDFTIWQRGDQDRNAGAYYAADRWRWSTGGSFILSRNQPRGFRFNQLSFLANRGVNFSQNIESVHTLSNYDGQQVTCSFEYRVDSQANTTPENTPAFVLLLQNVYGVPEDTNNDGTDDLLPSPVEEIYRGALTAFNTDGEWHRYSVTIDIPETVSKTITGNNADYTAIQMNIRNIADTGVGIYALDFREFQIEPGPVATPFEHRPIGTELALCQRYFIRFKNDRQANGTRFITGGYGDGQSRMRFSRQLPVTMRTAPDLSFSGNFQVQSSGSGFVDTDVYGTGCSNNTLNIFCTRNDIGETGALVYKDSTPQIDCNSEF